MLVKFKIDAYGGDGKKLDPIKVNWSSPTAKSLTYKQQPGPENPLGFVKINFNNAHSVYMHDTPSQSLFGRNFRAASSGCVRVQGIEHLAAWLLAEQGWKPEHVQQMKETGERLDVRLKKPVPLLFRLHHRLGDRGRRRPVPPRPLPEGRHRPAGRRLLSRLVVFAAQLTRCREPCATLASARMRQCAGASLLPAPRLECL